MPTSVLFIWLEYYYQAIRSICRISSAKQGREKNCQTENTIIRYLAEGGEWDRGLGMGVCVGVGPQYLRLEIAILLNA